MSASKRRAAHPEDASAPEAMTATSRSRTRILAKVTTRKVFDEQGKLQDPAVRAQVEKYITDFAQFVVRVMAALIFVVGFVESARVQAAPQTERRTVAARRMNDEEIIELDGRRDEGRGSGQCRMRDRRTASKFMYTYQFGR